jgi:hypothetical protein
MTNPTSNFGWQMPTSTDLVTDLPADFEVFGQAVDTSLADLKGGTTGQVLSKASNTNMDFTWVTTDDANAIQNSIVDAKGDLIAASANDTPARLAVGNNGETLVADSSTSTGLRYTAGTVQSNPVLNSAMQVWQRGTSISVAANTTPYVADRWQALTGLNQATTISRQATNDTTNLPNIQYCARVQRNSGQTGTTINAIYNSFETINSIPYAGKTVTMSFYARKGADYSPTSSILTARLGAGTGTDQNVYTGFTSFGYVVDQNATLTTTWQRFTYTGTIGTTTTQLAVGFAYTPTGTASTNDYFEVTGVQIDIGSVALPFRTYAGTIQGETSACQRYYQLIASGNNQPIATSAYYTTTLALSNYNPPVTMRTAPTIDVVSGSNYYIISANSTQYGFSAPSIGLASSTIVRFDSTTSAATSGAAGYFSTNNASAFLGLKAEL